MEHFICGDRSTHSWDGNSCSAHRPDECLPQAVLVPAQRAARRLQPEVASAGVGPGCVSPDLALNPRSRTALGCGAFSCPLPLFFGPCLFQPQFLHLLGGHNQSILRGITGNVSFPVIIS